MIAITDFINCDFKPFDIATPIGDVQDFFALHLFSHFPVTDGTIYIGAISAEDAETFETKKTLADYRYALEGFYVRTNMIWLDVMEVLARNNADVVAILDANNSYKGYYLSTDIVKFFYDTPFLKELGGIIVVQKPLKEYTMSQVAQIVESNNNKIIGVFVSYANTETVQITIKMALGSFNEIIQTFRRFNYEIISKHDEDAYLFNLKERSEYLDKYLNI
jgi:hypothetical protein